MMNPEFQIFNDYGEAPKEAYNSADGRPWTIKKIQYRLSNTPVIDAFLLVMGSGTLIDKVTLEPLFVKSWFGMFGMEVLSCE